MNFFVRRLRIGFN